MEHSIPNGKTDTLVLVGKGITFDSGGISIKPSEKMEEMKGDMSGGAVVIAIIAASAKMKLPLHLIGLVPACENLPSGTALKPGDILKSYSGKTIEVISTDAEGRLILADALSYAGKYNPKAIIDIATLTGACVIALGHVGCGMLGNNPGLKDKIRKASLLTGEKVWELPLWEEYNEQIKSDLADVKNTGGRPAGTITAAAFLQKFVGNLPWVHLDIAGMDWEEKGKPYIPKGGIGFGVKLILQFLRGWAKI
jgi:leucyl aminopeptidase